MIDPVAARDFFISYTSADRAWAEWIAWQLEEAGYQVKIQAWDFSPGGNFVVEMQKATVECERTIAVFSPNYFLSEFGAVEWAAAFRLDPTGKNEKLIPVRIEDCQPPGLLGSLIYIDLVKLDETTARERLLTGLPKGRRKPSTGPQFPGASDARITASAAKPQFPGALPQYWNVPVRNRLFTGREDVLEKLHGELERDRRAALSGLGGIGKTQTAIEYAHRYRNDYNAAFFIRTDSETALTAGIVEIAGVLALPGRDAKDQKETVGAVKRWLLEHDRWLLIADNADDLALVKNVLPFDGPGRILLTTRAAGTGAVAEAVKVGKMEPEEGARFLLRRAGLLGSDSGRESAPSDQPAAARELSIKLDGLPLALDQAGSYIEETGCGLGGYLELYRNHAPELLRRRGMLVFDYPESVAITWALSFEKIKKANPAAAELLRCCAFLHPDKIPEELFSKGARELGPRLAPVGSDGFLLNRAISEILKYSMLRRDSNTNTLEIHRLVQAVLKQGMNNATQRLWAERAVRAVNRAFPRAEFTAWPACERLLSQAYACAELIDECSFEFSEAARLLNNAGFYSFERGRYTDAQRCQERALAIREKALGPEDPYVAESLDNLALLYHDLGRCAKAEPLYQRSLAIYEKVLGPEHPNVASSLSNLARAYHDQEQYSKAEPLYEQALAIREKAEGSEGPNVASSLSDLARLYHDRDQYAKAEHLYERALAIRENILGPEHPNVALSLNDLGRLYHAQDQYSKAEPRYKRALAIREKALGPEHPDVAWSLNGLALLYHTLGQYSKAEPRYKRLLAIFEKALGPEHPDVATSLENYAALLRKMDRPNEAAPLESRARAIREKHA